MTGTTLRERGVLLRPSIVQTLPRFVAPLAIGLLLAYALQRTLPDPARDLDSKLVLDIGINVILAVSLNLVNGFTGQFSMGHAGFMAVGGYVAATISYYGSFRLWESPDVNPGAGTALFLGATLAGGIVAAGMGYVVGLPSLRLRGDYLAIVTLGFGEIVRVLATITSDVLTDADEVKATPWVLAWEDGRPAGLVTKLGGALGFQGVSGIPGYTNHLWTYAFVTLTIVTAYRIKVSSWGRAFLSVRENEIAAEAMGVDVTRIKVRAFVLSAFFAGIAGSLYAHEVCSLMPAQLGFMKSFDVIIMVVLGGMGSISGATLAAAILTLLPEWLRKRSFDVGSVHVELNEYRLIIYALLLVLMMILRPKGLFGIREVWELGPFKRLFGDRNLPVGEPAK